jgi:hypothetical protein
MLVDIVSKNGNLMLNIPLPGSGMPDSDELAFLADFTKWMAVNGEGIYGTRPWGVFGEGPSGGGAALQAQGFNESNRAYTSRDFRFMRKGDALYAFAMRWPDDGKLVVRSLASGAGRVDHVRLLGYPGRLTWSQTDRGLEATLPAQKPCDYVYGLEIVGKGLTPVPVDTAPIVIEPKADGKIVLKADDVTIHGGSPQIENKDGVDDVGYWGSADDFVSWDFDVPSPGSYSVDVDSSCAPEAEGSTFAVSAAGQALTGTTVSTGSWGTFAVKPLGSLTFSQAGKQTLTFKPQSASPWKGIALRSVVLTRTQ